MLASRMSIAVEVILGLFVVTLGAHAQQPLELDLEGEITARCEVLGIGALDGSLDLADGGVLSLDFDISCNLPMQLELTSKNGALINDALDRLSGGNAAWSARMLYEATLTVDAIGLSETASSEAMAAGVTYRSGNEIPFDTSGKLMIRPLLNGQSHPAGRYQDVISIAIFADVGAGV